MGRCRLHVDLSICGHSLRLQPSTKKACQCTAGRDKLLVTVKNAAQPKSCGWVFNYSNYMQGLPLTECEYLPCGTTSNEALHKELSTHINVKQPRYDTSLQQHIEGFHLAKVIAHSSAVCRPTTKQVRQCHLPEYALSNHTIWTDRQWAKFCERVNSGPTMEGPTTSAIGHRLKHQRAVREYKAAQVTTPAFYKRHFGIPTTRCIKKTTLKTNVRPFKRTAFTQDKGNSRSV